MPTGLLFESPSKDCQILNDCVIDDSISPQRTKAEKHQDAAHSSIPFLEKDTEIT
jgi:hypothetical protein